MWHVVSVKNDMQHEPHLGAWEECLHFEVQAVTDSRMAIIIHTRPEAYEYE